MAEVVRQVATARIPTRFGEFIAHAFVATDLAGAELDSQQASSSNSREPMSGLGNQHRREHLACVLGDIGDLELRGEALDLSEGATDIAQEPVLVRVHSECITGDVLGSQRCDCGAQLEMAMEIIGTAGKGVLLYLRDHEGRGIGLEHKLRAYELQDAGHDTVDANLHQGLPIDARDYAIAAQILAHLGVTKVRLLTNNPVKLQSLTDMGITVSERVPLQTLPSMENADYLRTKRDKLGHLFDDAMTSFENAAINAAVNAPISPLDDSDPESTRRDIALLAVSSLDISDTESHPFPATTHVAPVS